MYLVVNNELEHRFEVQGISREMIPNAAGKKQFFIRIIANEKLEETLAYCEQFVANDITNLKLFAEDNNNR